MAYGKFGRDVITNTAMLDLDAKTVEILAHCNCGKTAPINTSQTDHSREVLEQIACLQ